MMRNEKYQAMKVVKVVKIFCFLRSPYRCNKNAAKQQVQIISTTSGPALILHSLHQETNIEKSEVKGGMVIIYFSYKSQTNDMNVYNDIPKGGYSYIFFLPTCVEFGIWFSDHFNNTS